MDFFKKSQIPYQKKLRRSRTEAFRRRVSYWPITETIDAFMPCGCWLIVLVVNVFVGSWSVNYLLEVFVGKTIPWIGAAVIGLFAGEITIPVAIVVAILRWGGIL